MHLLLDVIMSASKGSIMLTRNSSCFLLAARTNNGSGENYVIKRGSFFIRFAVVVSSIRIIGRQSRLPGVR